MSARGTHAQERDKPLEIQFSDAVGKGTTEYRVRLYRMEPSYPPSVLVRWPGGAKELTDDLDELVLKVTGKAKQVRHARFGQQEVLFTTNPGEEIVFPVGGDGLWDHSSARTDTMASGTFRSVCGEDHCPRGFVESTSPPGEPDARCQGIKKPALICHKPGLIRFVSQGATRLTITRDIGLDDWKEVKRLSDGQATEFTFASWRPCCRIAFSIGAHARVMPIIGFGEKWTVTVNAAGVVRVDVAN